MKKLVSLISIIALAAVVTMGCAGYVAKDTKVKCPKCGAVFTIDEGLKAITP